MRAGVALRLPRRRRRGALRHAAGAAGAGRAVSARPEAGRDHRPRVHAADSPHRPAGRREAGVRDRDGARGRSPRGGGAGDLRAGPDDRWKRAAVARRDESGDSPISLTSRTHRARRPRRARPARARQRRRPRRCAGDAREA